MRQRYRACGRTPINVSGGLGRAVTDRGHGLQIYELVTQLRTAGARQVEGAHHAIAENGGGFHHYEEATACITILER